MPVGSIGQDYASADDRGFTPRFIARCQCGAVAYQVRTDPVDAKVCHCRNCQTLHGAPMQWAAIFHKRDVRFIEGVDHLRFFSSSRNRYERTLPCKVSCALCGTPIADEGRNMWLAFPTLFDFGNPPRVPESFRPTCHIFYGMRVLDVIDGLPKWSGHKDRSTLLPECRNARRRIGSSMKSETVVCVGALVMNNDALLAVRQAKGHPLEGCWTVPWGRLEDGESPSLAVLREVEEEGGVSASVDGLLGVQELPDPWLGWIAMVYLCSYVGGEPKPDGKETDRARFLTLEQLDSLGEPIEPWSEWIMRRVLRKDYTVTNEGTSNPFSPSIGFL